MKKYLSLRNDFTVGFIVTIGWKIILTAAGLLITHASYTANWDGGWYLNVIHTNYAAPGSPAFYPLFPALVAGLHVISFGSLGLLLCGQIINTIAAFLAIVALIKLSRLLLGEQKRFWPVALFLSAPAAFFLAMFYSEAVFVAIGFWAYYFALQKRWPIVGILLGVLTAARLPSVLFIALCGLEFLRSYRWKPSKFFNKQLPWFLLAPVGFLAYGTYLAITQHHFFAMFSAYEAVKDWPYQIFNPDIFETLLKQAYQLVRVAEGVRPFDVSFFVNCLVPLVCLVALATCSLILVLYKKDRRLLPLGIVGFLAIVMFTINSNVVSAHRYVLPLLAIYIALPVLATKKWHYWVIVGVCCVGASIQAMLFYLFVTDHFAG